MKGIIDLMELNGDAMINLSDAKSQEIPVGGESIESLVEYLMASSYSVDLNEKAGKSKFLVKFETIFKRLNHVIARLQTLEKKLDERLMQIQEHQKNNEATNKKQDGEIEDLDKNAKDNRDSITELQGYLEKLKGKQGEQQAEIKKLNDELKTETKSLGDVIEKLSDKQKSDK